MPTSIGSFEIDADEVGRFAAAVDRSTLAFESLGYPEPVTPSSVWLTQPSSATMETIPR